MPGCQTREENAAEAARDEARLLAEANALDEAYADAVAFDGKMQAEAYDKDLRALVAAARQVAEDFDLRHLMAVVEQFEPWLDGEDSQDPRANGWVDDKGQP